MIDKRKVKDWCLDKPQLTGSVKEICMYKQTTKWKRNGAKTECEKYGKGQPPVTTLTVRQQTCGKTLIRRQVIRRTVLEKRSVEYLIGWPNAGRDKAYQISYDRYLEDMSS